MPETNMSNLMANWDTMSMEELGSSLLARKGEMAARAAKQRKKDDRIAMAMGVLMAGQTIFKNAVDNRLEENNAIGALRQGQADVRQNQIQKIAPLYNHMQNFRGDTKYTNADEFIEAFANSADFDAFVNALGPDMDAMFKGHIELDTSTGTGSALTARRQLSKGIAKNMYEGWGDFNSQMRGLFTIGAEEDLYSRLTGLSAGDLEIVLAKRLADQNRQLRKSGRITNVVDNVKNVLDSFGLAYDYDEDKQERLTALKARLDAGELTEEDYALALEKEKKRINIFREISYEKEAWEITMDKVSPYATMKELGDQMKSNPAYGDWTEKGMAIDDWSGEGALIDTYLNDLNSLYNNNYRMGLDKTWGLGSAPMIGNLNVFNEVDQLQEELRGDIGKQYYAGYKRRIAGLMARLQEDQEFNKAMFNTNTPIRDINEIARRATAYVIGVSAKHKSEIVAADLPFGKQGMNFDHSFDTVDRTIYGMFRIEDGQFIAEQAFWNMDFDHSRLGALEEEIKHIMGNLTNISEQDRLTLQNKLIEAINPVENFEGLATAEFKANMKNAYDIDWNMTNAEIVDSINAMGDDISWEEAYEFFMQRQPDVIKKSRKTIEDDRPRTQDRGQLPTLEELQPEEEDYWYDPRRMEDELYGTFSPY